MPVLEDKICVVLSVGIVVSVLDRLKVFFESNQFKSINDALPVDIEDLSNSIDCSIDSLKERECEHIIILDAYNPIRLSRELDRFKDGYFGKSETLKKHQYERLLRQTKRLIQYLNECPEKSFLSLQDAKINKAIRAKDPLEEQNRLSELNKKRLELRTKYELALQESPKDEEKIRQLKIRLEELGDAVVESRKTIGDIKIDTAEEMRMRERIDKAFDELKNVNNLDEELEKLKREYYVMLWAIGITIILFLIYYVCFLYSLRSLCLITWYDYLPYTICVPITVALLWLFVYLKNRASKISIDMSVQLYDIHYLEGLLKLTNSISRTSDEALDNIERIVNTMVDSFLEKAKRNDFEEKELSKLEKQELENSPYWKIIRELTEIIKTIKK